MALADRVHDVVSGRSIRHPNVDAGLHQRVNRQAMTIGREIPVIDATMIYTSYQAKPGIAIYEDHPCVKAPWPLAWVGYRNEHGNELVTLVVEHTDTTELWESLAGNDLSAAAGALWCWTWSGGQAGDGRSMPTFGPFMLTRIAVDEFGTPLDINWVAIDSGEQQGSDWPRWTVLGSYNLLNCRNTVLAPAPMPRAARRRQQRLGGIVESIIHIDSRGTSHHTAGSSQTSVALERLHSVRGHVAHYGACCPHHEPAGLLFGRITGRVWVPQHARGNREAGRTRQTFVLDDEAS